MHNTTLFKIILTGFISCMSFLLVRGQTIPVGSPALDALYRRYQLLGLVDSSLSFAIRPLHAQALQQNNLFDPDGSFPSRSVIAGRPGSDRFMQLLPVSWEQQVNTSYPYGWNDGSMIPARGYQTRFSAGIYARYKWFSIQLRPEVVYAQNRRYEGFGGAAGPNEDWYNFIGNRIDMPEIFGLGNYTRVFPGQSSVRITFKPISLGFSTENLWWGPGQRNSILMSNTAPGFAHVTLNTVSPIRTPIGSFEGQVVGGRLEDSGFPPSLLGDTSVHNAYYLPKRNDWRYFAGMVVSYQPRWLPGLSLGLIRVFSIYHQDMGNGITDYFPFFTPGLKEGVAGADDEDPKQTDQGVSFFFRWAIPAAKAEVYAEYARNDHPWDFRDLYTQLDHSRGYVVGITKLIPLSSPQAGEHIAVNAEVTQLSATNTRRIRAYPTWYVHHQIRHGYTNLGQVMGAGIGPGSNAQSIDVSWVRGLKNIGLRAERLSHNEDLADEFYDDHRRYWVDASLLGYASCDYKHFIASAGLQFIHAYNYQYQFKQENASDEWDFDPQDKNNFHAYLSLTYRF